MFEYRKSNVRRAMTLLELLIVIAIMLLLAAAAIPRFLPAMREHKMREASRMLNAFFAGAKARAAERNRPVGVMFERDPNLLNACRQVYLVEVPPPYTGELASSTASVNGGTLTFSSDNVTLTGTDTILAPGEYFQIKFDYQGPLYLAQRISGITFVLHEPAPDRSSVQFQIYRRPQKIAGSPLTLPEGIVVDLGFSGIGTVGKQFDAYRPVPVTGSGPQTIVSTPAIGVAQSEPAMVMFAPSGSLEGVYSGGTGTMGLGLVATQNIFFLLGRNERISVASWIPETVPLRPSTYNNTTKIELQPTNLADTGAFWIAINARTGAITSAENADFTIEVAGSGSLAGDLGRRILNARQIARSGQAKGGI